MKPITNATTRDNQVPLQRSSAVWVDEPGYGGSPEAWTEFQLSIDEQLAALEAKHPAPRRVPNQRPR